MRSKWVFSFFIGFMLVGSISSVAQNIRVAKPTDYSQEFESKWVTGGDFGLGFSTNASNITVAPQLGYRFTNKAEAGTRLIYNYFGAKDRFSKYRSHNYGAGIYASYDFFKGILAHAETELLSYKPIYLTGAGLVQLERMLIHSVFIGGGYRQYFSPKSYSTIYVLFNLNETLDSPYNSPTIRVGFGIGL